MTDRPPPPPRRPLGPTGPSRTARRRSAATAIVLAAASLIFHRQVVTLLPPLPYPAILGVLAVYWLATVDLAACLLRGREVRTAAFMIVSLGGGVTLVAAALTPLGL